MESIPVPEISASTVTEDGSEQGGITGMLKLALNVGAWINSTVKGTVSAILQVLESMAMNNTV